MRAMIPAAICMVVPIPQQKLIRIAVPARAVSSRTMLETETTALIAVPFYFLRACRGVISCVQLSRPGSQSANSPGFRPKHLDAMQRTASILSNLMEYQLLSCAVGWKNC